MFHKNCRVGQVNNEKFKFPSLRPRVAVALAVAQARSPPEGHSRAGSLKIRVKRF
jgi:hypothetical protein